MEHVRDRFFELLNARGEGVKLAIFFLGTSPGVDLAGAELLEELHHALAERGIALRLAEARGNVREALGRDPGLRVAILDYFVNVSRELRNPKVIEIAVYERTERSAVSGGQAGLFNHAFVLHQALDGLSRVDTNA